VDNETGTSTTGTSGTSTDEGKGAEATGKDPTVSGLSKRLNQEKARADAAEAKLAEQALAAEEVAKFKRENSALKKTRQYADVASALDALFAKGVDPDSVDDDFIAAIRSAAPLPPKEQSEIETPTHSTTRSTTKPDADAAMKKLTPAEFWGSE